MRLDNKVAIVTGAGSGIGRAAAVLFAAELAPYNIRVNCIAPKITDTPMVRTDLEEMRKISTAAPSSPLMQPAQPEDMANAALFLASNEAAMVSGICLEVSGGQAM